MKSLKVTLIAAILAITTTPIASAAPAAWYVYASKLNGQKICAQFSPGSGWYKYSNTAYKTLGECNYYGRG
ncbi:hypothetical protein ACFOEE_00345 [Pseudoalteromonas fenneropenaei]|uniref:Uncharacterized protein n=1 Tax=Pseudoalteromonas fenneropenaei TaxID=1737459 RepID=A0ABV7CEI0_9GAMM